MIDSSSLINWEPYTDSTGVKRLTRVPEGSVEWQISAKNAKTYIISFEKNFSKKHLYTSTKKNDKVQAEAKKFWDAASAEDKKKWWWRGWWWSYPTELVEQAQKTLDEVKFKKQLGHRSALEGDICTTCGHPEKSHKTGSGVWCNCKYPVPANVGGLCGCAMGAAFAHVAGNDCNSAKPDTMEKNSGFLDASSFSRTRRFSISQSEERPERKGFVGKVLPAKQRLLTTWARRYERTKVPLLFTAFAATRQAGAFRRRLSGVTCRNPSPGRFRFSTTPTIFSGLRSQTGQGLGPFTEEY